MFGWFELKSPLAAEQRRWINERFAWLRSQFGEDRLRGIVVTPTDRFFPGRYTPTAEGAAMLLDRLCGYMDVDRNRLDLQLYTSPSADPVPAAFNPILQRGYALGAFQEEEGRITIWLEQSRLTEPDSAVSTLAHELGHVHLLADKRCDRSTPDHEPLTDLLAVYFGLGIFVANNAIREVNWRTGNVEGWSLSRQGYLNMPEHAYALALYALSRGEHHPHWLKFLRPDLRALFKTESKYLASSGILSSAAAVPHAPTMVALAGAVDRDAEGAVDDTPDEQDRSAAEEPEPPSMKRSDWYFTQGTLHASQGEHDLALGAFSQALQLNPRDPEFWLHRGQSHLRLGQIDDAIDACSWSLAYEPDDLAARCCRAQAYLWLGRHDHARKDMDEARRVDKRDAQVYYLRGLAHLGLGNNRRAIADLKKARRFAPTWAEIYLARSRAYEALGKTRRAHADLAEAIRRDPAFADPAARAESLAGHPIDHT
jgi:tetratricopeptide (TPR) repeat protein